MIYSSQLHWKNNPYWCLDCVWSQTALVPCSLLGRCAKLAQFCMAVLTALGLEVQVREVQMPLGPTFPHGTEEPA